MACKYTLDGQVLSELEFKQEVARRFANKPIDLNEIAKDFSVAKTEVSTQKLADLYKGRLDKLKKENPDQYWSVDMPSDEVINEAAKNGRIVDKNGGMGIVTEDGNMIGLFKYDESKKGTAKSVEDERIKMGGIKKDNFDGYLTKQYEKNGFKVVSRTPFSEEHAPEGWNKEKHGTPDVVFMVHDPEGKLDIKEKTFGSYDDAKAYQGKYANEAKANIEKPKQETKAEKPLSKKEKAFKAIEEKRLAKAKEAIDSVKKSLQATGIEVVDDAAEYQKAVDEGNGQKGMEGMFVADDGKIYLDSEKLKGEWGKTIVFHEGTHPVVNIIRNTNKALYDSMISGLNKAAETNADIREVMDWAKENYGAEGEGRVEDETVVETIARIGDGRLKLNEVPKSVKQAVIDLVNKAADMLGFDQVLSDTDPVAFKKMAEKIATALREGQDISKVVGEENVGKYENTINRAIEFNEDGVSVYGGKVSQARVASAKVEDVYEEKEVEGLKPVSLGKVLEKFGNKAVIINSDPTRVGKLKLPSGKEIFMYGGSMYGSIKENIQGNVGFATTMMGKVNSHEKLSKSVFGEGNKGVTLVATQTPFSLLSNSYSLRVVLDAISQLPKTVRRSSEFKNEFFGKDIFLFKTVMGEDGYKDFISKYGRLDLGEQEVVDGMIKDMAYKFGEDNSPKTFKVRGSFVSNLLAGIAPKSSRAGMSGEAGYVSKEPNKFIAKRLKSEFGLTTEKMFYDLGQKNVVDQFMDKGNWGFVTSGFETNPNIKSESVQSKGVKHPLFNAKFAGENPFILDGLYSVDKLLSPQDITAQSGEPYTKKASLMLAGSMYVGGGEKMSGADGASVFKLNPKTSAQASKGNRGDYVKDTYYEPHMTESKDKKDYVFFHVSGADAKDLAKGIDSSKKYSTRTSREEKGLQYGVASYYTKPADGERMVGGEKYAVHVPKDKVYPMDTDPNGYREKAEVKIKEGTPFREERVRKEIAEAAKKDGYLGGVGEWGYDRTGGESETPALRFDAFVPLKPEKNFSTAKEKELPKGVSIEPLDFEEMGDSNIDPYKASHEADKIAKETGVNILRGKDIKNVAVDKKGKVVGGLWTEIDGNEFSFDIAVDKSAQGKGVGESLVREAIQEFKAQDDGDRGLVYKIDVTNPAMEKLLGKYGFVVDKKVGGHTIMSHPTNDPKISGYQPATTKQISHPDRQALIDQNKLMDLAEGISAWKSGKQKYDDAYDIAEKLRIYGGEISPEDFKTLTEGLPAKLAKQAKEIQLSKGGRNADVDEYHDDYVEAAKAGIEEDPNYSIEDLAKDTGYSVEDLQGVWDDATGANKATGGVKKTIVTKRAYEGKVRENVKKELERVGLTREVENQQDAKGRAKEFVEAVGEEDALDAVRNDDVDGATAAYIWNEVLEGVDKKIATETDPAKVAELEALQAQLFDEFGKKALEKGRFSSALNDIYQNSDLGYNVEKKISDYKEANGGEIPADVEKRFRDLDAELKEVKGKLAMAEQKEKLAQEAQVIADIRDAAKRKPIRDKKAEAKELYNQGFSDIAEALGVKLMAVGDQRATVVSGLTKIGKGLILDGEATIENVSEKLKEALDKKFGGKFNFEDYKSDFEDAIKDFGKTAGKIKIDTSLIKGLVEGGIDNIDDLVKAVKREVREEYPDATDREIRDAITGYGKISNPSREEVDVELRKMKRIGRTISALEDVAEKKRPLRSGQQRDKLDAEERALNKELREAMKDLPVDSETEERQLKTALDSAKSRMQNQIEDLEREIASGEKTQQNARTVKADEELSNLKEKRDELKKKHDELFKDEEFKAAKRLEFAKKAAQRRIDELGRRLREGDFSKKEKKPLIQDTELTKLKAEKLRIQEEYDKEFYKAKLKNRTQAEVWKDHAWEAWGMTRALRATGEFSFVGVQGLVNTIAHPMQAAKAFKTAMEFMSSEKKTEQWLRNIKSQDFYPIMKESKLALTEPNAEISAREELFYSGWSNIIWNSLGTPLKLVSKDAYSNWVSANPMKAVERASVGYLDSIRVQRFLDGMEMLAEKGLDPSTNKEAYKNVADVINTFTGRASLGVAEQIAPTLSKVFFSPRNWASALKMTILLPRQLAKWSDTGKPFKASVAQKMAISDLSKFVGLTTSMVALAAAGLNNDDDPESGVEFDPTSSDFGKIKIGNKRIDPWGGKIQQIVLASRMIIGSTKSTMTGKEKPLGSFRTPTREELLIEQAVNKLAPSASIIHRRLSTHIERGEVVDKYGQPYSLGGDIAENLTPIFWGSTVPELLKDDPSALNGLLAFYAFFGGGISIYDKKEQESSGGKPKMAKPVKPKPHQ